MSAKESLKFEEGKRYLIQRPPAYRIGNDPVDVLVLELAPLTPHGYFVKLQFPGGPSWAEIGEWEILVQLSSLDMDKRAKKHLDLEGEK